MLGPVGYRLGKVQGDRAEGQGRSEAGVFRCALGEGSHGKDFGVTSGDGSTRPAPHPHTQLWETEKEGLPQPL